MCADEDPSPLNLEQFLDSPAPSEDDISRDVSQYEEIDTDLFRTKLGDFLAAVPEDDPLWMIRRCKPSLPRPGGESFTVQEIPGKGMGVIASRSISRGSIILTDPFAISIQEPTEDPFPDYETNGLFGQVLLQLLEQYNQLPVTKREQFASLHPHMQPGARAWLQEQLGRADARLSEAELDFVARLYHTFNTNEFSKTEPGRCGMWTVRRLFLLTARINHSCCANARSRQTTDGYKVVTAARDIEEGEEITLKYLDHVRFSREGWRATTQRTWGFVCDCYGCCSKMDRHE